MSEFGDLSSKLRRLESMESELRRRISQSMQRTSSYAATEHCKDMQRQVQSIQEQITVIKKRLAYLSLMNRTRQNSNPPPYHPPAPQKSGCSFGWIIVGVLALVAVLAIFGKS